MIYNSVNLEGVLVRPGFSNSRFNSVLRGCLIHSSRASGVAHLPKVREFVHVSVSTQTSAGHFLTPQVARVELARDI